MDDIECTSDPAMFSFCFEHQFRPFKHKICFQRSKLYILKSFYIFGHVSLENKIIFVLSCFGLNIQQNVLGIIEIFREF